MHLEPPLQNHVYRNCCCEVVLQSETIPMLDMVIDVQALSRLSTDQTVIEYVCNLFIMQGVHATAIHFQRSQSFESTPLQWT